MSRRHAKAAIVAVFLATIPGFAQQEMLTGKDLVAALQKGGHVIYFRHPSTHQDQADTDTMHLDNPKAQRHLTDAGRAQAKSVGEAFRALKIPVDSIRTSKFYRAMEAARLLDLGECSSLLELTEPVNVSPNEAKRRANFLKKALATEPPEGKNAILVGHRGCLQDAVGKEVGDMTEGEAVIFRPDGKSFKMIARVKIGDWEVWAK